MKPKNKTGKEKKITDLHYAKKVLEKFRKEIVTNNNFCVL